MDTQLFMECEEEELEPWQQVDDSVEEEDVDFLDNCEPGEHTCMFIPLPCLIIYICNPTNTTFKKHLVAKY